MHTIELTYTTTSMMIRPAVVVPPPQTTSSTQALPFIVTTGAAAHRSTAMSRTTTNGLLLLQQSFAAFHVADSSYDDSMLTWCFATEKHETRRTTGPIHHQEEITYLGQFFLQLRMTKQITTTVW